MALPHTSAYKGHPVGHLSSKQVPWLWFLRACASSLSPSCLGFLGSAPGDPTSQPSARKLDPKPLEPQCPSTPTLQAPFPGDFHLLVFLLYKTFMLIAPNWITYINKKQKKVNHPLAHQAVSAIAPVHIFLQDLFKEKQKIVNNAFIEQIL